MGYGWTNLNAAIAGSANRYVTSVAMKNTVAYTLTATVTPPTSGARHVTCTRTVVGGADTPGTVLVTGKDLGGNVITETLTPGAHTILVTGTKWFASITSIVGAGWATNTGDDTIVFGCDDMNVVASSSGVLHAITVNTTAAGTITIADQNGTIAVLPANVAVGQYVYDVNFSGYLRVEPVAASNITVEHTATMPSVYALS